MSGSSNAVAVLTEESDRRYRDNLSVLERFRGRPRTVTVPVTDETAEWFGETKNGLCRRGRPIPINDVWIAASCMEHGALLLTRDMHFAEIDGLRLA